MILGKFDVSLFAKRSCSFHFEYFSSLKHSLNNCRFLDLYSTASTESDGILNLIDFLHTIFRTVASVTCNSYENELFSCAFFKHFD